ncbi:MAG: hypothetical protein RLZZ142_1656, partial [Verrucomicrobiota bacterium]
RGLGDRGGDVRAVVLPAFFGPGMWGVLGRGRGEEGGRELLGLRAGF